MLRNAAVRATHELDSEQTGALRSGTVISVLETVRVAVEDSENSIVRVRFIHGSQSGWTSVRARSGNFMLELTEEPETEADHAQPEAADSSALSLSPVHSTREESEESSAKANTDSAPVKKQGVRRRMSLSVGKSPRVTPPGLQDEDMFECKQGRSSCQLAVGTIALQVFKTDGAPVENILYQSMASWRAVGDDRIEIKLSEAAGGKILTWHSTPRAAQIVEQMTSHAKELRMAQQMEPSSSAAAANAPHSRDADSSDDSADDPENDEEEPADSKLVKQQSGRCKVLKGSILREGLELDSPECGRLEQGTVFSVLEAVELEATVRVRLEHGGLAGWASTVARSGTRLLEATDDELTEPTDSSSASAAAAASAV